MVANLLRHYSYTSLRGIILSANPPPQKKKNKVEVILGCSTARLQMFLN